MYLGNCHWCFWENYMGSHFLQRWCKRWFKCLPQHHVNNFATAMQLEQRLKEPATSFDLLWVTNKKHSQPHFSTYEAKSLIYVWCLKIPCISSSSLFSFQSFPILIIVSGVLLPELHGAQTSRSATRSWIQLGCEQFWPTGNGILGVEYV